MARKCLNCGGGLSDKREDAKFCGLSCKNSYNYKGKNKSLKGTEIKPKDNNLSESLKGVIKIEPGKEIENKIEQPDILPKPEIKPGDLRNTIVLNADLADLNADKRDEEKPAEKKQEPVLPPQYIEKVTKTKNTNYEISGLVLNQSKKDKQVLEQQYKKLETKLLKEQQRDGSEWETAGTTFGFATGVVLSNDSPQSEQQGLTLLDRDGNEIPFKHKKKWKKKKLRRSTGVPDIVKKLGCIVVCTYVGRKFGKVVKKLTEASREKSKQANTAKIQQDMDEIKKKIEIAKASISSNTKLLGAVPEYEIKKEKILNPEYTKAINGLAQQQAKAKEKPDSKQPFKPQSDKIISAKEANNMTYTALNFGGLWKEFFGMPSVNFCFLIHGNAGEGKSTFCMWFARYLSENFGRVLYVSGEEGLNSTFQDKLKFCKADVDDMHVLDVRTGDEFLKEVQPGEFHFIVLDSLHDMNIDAKKMKAIKERYKNTAFIGVDQNNKKGDLYGTNEMKHLFDTVVNVKDYTAETTKNRFIEKGKSFKTADFMENDRPATGKLKIISMNKDNENSSDLNSDKWKVI